MGKAAILVVEDEAIVAADLSAKLGHLGYDISGAADSGEKAIARVRAQQPDLILMDIRLAGAMDGVETAEIIGREFDLPIIFLTAHSDRATLERAKVTEPFGYILKPFDYFELESHIEMALYKHQAERRLRQAHDELERRVQERTQALHEAQKMLTEINESLELRVVERTAELEAANMLLRDSRRAALNMMEDAETARRNAEETTTELRRESRERRRAEAQLEAINIELERRVEQRTRELQETQKQYLHAEKLSAIGKLSASIAHEFNNPLQGIRTVLTGLKKRAIMDQEDRNLLDTAIEESDRMKDLIRSLQDFNRPSSHKKTYLDLHKSLDSILLLQKSDFKGKGIKVVCDYAQQLPQILVIPDQIKQVLLNLLTNAADACQHPGETIMVSTRWQGEQVAVAITDTGIGIKPEDMDRIFQPFFTTKPEVKGTGLGLSVSYGIVKRHQGQILVDSRPGEGATFTVVLPIEGDDPDGATDA